MESGIDKSRPVLLINNHKLVEEAYRNRFGEEGYVAFMIVGKEGSGKTAYALWLGYLVYRDWDLVLKHLYFDPLDALKDFKKAVCHGKRLKYVIFDDAGLWISKYRTLEKNITTFIEFYNIIRSIVAAVVFTSPSDEVQRMFREKAWIRLIAEPLTFKTAKKYDIPVELLGLDLKNTPLSIARVYELNISPTLERYVSRKNIEIYSRHYPVYKRYKKMRMKAIEKKMAELETFMERKVDYKMLEKYAAWVLVRLKGYGVREAARILRVKKSTLHVWVRKVDDMLESM